MITKTIKTTVFSCLLTLTISGWTVLSSEILDEETIKTTKPSVSKKSQGNEVGIPEIFHNICEFLPVDSVLHFSQTSRRNQDNKERFIISGINIGLQTLNTMQLPFQSQERLFKRILRTSEQHRKIAISQFKKILGEEGFIFVNPDSIFNFLLEECVEKSGDIKKFTALSLYENPLQTFDTIVDMHLLGSVDIYGIKDIFSQSLAKARLKVLKKLTTLKKQHHYVEYTPFLEKFENSIMTPEK